MNTKSLNKLLFSWLHEGLIDESTLLSIQRFEAKNNALQSSTALSRMRLIGWIAIVLGTTAIISSNWSEISLTVKWSLYTIFLIGNAIAVFVYFAQLGWIREGLLIVYSGLLLGGIGLATQTFHLSGNFESALVFWCTMTLSLAWAAHSVFLPALWSFAFLGACATANVTFLKVFGSFQPVIDFVLENLNYFFVLLPLLARNSSRPFAKVASFVGFFFILIDFYILAAFQILDHGSVFGDRQQLLAQSFLSRLIQIGPEILLTSVVGYMLFRKRVFIGSLHSGLLSICLFLASAIRLLPPLLGLDLPPYVEQVSAALVCWLFGLALLNAGFKSYFDIAVAAAVGQIVLIYINVFAPLLSTGFGLLISGLFVVAISSIWFRLRPIVLRNWLTNSARREGI